MLLTIGGTIPEVMEGGTFFIVLDATDSRVIRNIAWQIIYALNTFALTRFDSLLIGASIYRYE
jgi:hypothetical protein